MGLDARRPFNISARPKTPEHNSAIGNLGAVSASENIKFDKEIEALLKAGQSHA
jgi:hypothetical protein